ncbi:uncharacterized protein [Nicotiana tomentosiformis]|uniref:uncharacterized protein isoform X2 n=1 Tax=Nicotiana tomentosiformis TaxID=4098 RepID=UPI000878615E|nr:uncharacterized protein LOC104085055 isoform X3 [Nicotiana tomentosiformis]
MNFMTFNFFFMLDNSEVRKVRGPTLLKDIWKLPPEKKITVQFNNHNQAIGKEGRKLASLLGIIARTPDLTPLHIDDWRSFDKEEMKKLLEFVRRRTQTNRNNRAKQNMPHTGGSKSIATLMDEQDMMNERLRDTDGSNDQPPRSVAWEGNVYSLGNDKSRYVRGLGLGPTRSMLWGSRSSLANIFIEDSSDEVVQKLKHEITELNEKQNDEMSFTRQELSWMRQVMRKIAPNEIHMPQNINGVSIGQVVDINRGHERIPQSPNMHNVAGNTPSSRGTFLCFHINSFLFYSFFLSISEKHYVRNILM